MMLDNELNVIDQAGAQVNQPFIKPPREDARELNDVEPQSRSSRRQLPGRIIKLRLYTDSYLYVARLLDRGWSRNCRRRRPA